VRRAARIGDGWIPNYPTAEEARPHFEKIRGYLAEEGRATDDFGLEVRLHYREGDPKRLVGLVRDWEAAGATHVGLNTMRSRLSGPGEHLAAMRAFAENVLG
jgi:alkanesulfonate monooxygenase SsuD/methylene tetrahydromethanopterin reductase-like flavin-dependent oxidoreductase (luciferase family)